MENKRNYGIDLLRIVSMYMVVVLHVLGRGGIVDYTEPFSVFYGLAWMLEITCYCAVNCYALISGYVGIDSDYKISRIAKLWGRVFFYSVGITVLFYLYNKELVTGNDWLNAFFPIMRKHYWFFTAYFLMYLCVPVLHHILNTMPQKQLKNWLLSILLFVSVLQTLFTKDVFQTNNGFSVLWLTILYIIGGYIKRYGFMQQKSPKWFAMIFVLSTAIIWCGEYAVEYIMYMRNGEFHSYNVLLKYISPFVLINAIALVCMFSRVKVGKICSKIIRVIAPLSFSVYLIHVHLLVWNHIMFHRFQKYLTYGPIKFIVMVLLTAFLIFVACILIDAIRSVFVKLGMKAIKSIKLGGKQ